MFNHYLKIAYRANLNHKRHSILNIFGLALGLSAALVVGLFVQHELSYDKWQPNVDTTYRVDLDFSSFGFDVQPSANLNRSQKFKTRSGVEDVFGLVRASDIDSSLTNVNYGGNSFQLASLFVATENIESFIKLKIVDGDIREALDQPWQLALSQKEATRIFGQDRALGKVLNTQKGVYTVAAVFEDLPENTHFAFTSLTYNDSYISDLRTHMHYVYVRLASNVDLNALELSLSHAYTIGDEIDRLKVKLTPIKDIHLHHISDLKLGGSWETVLLCFLLSGLLVAVSCINFVNMSIAQVARRAKEAGIRKTLGASQSQLIFQYLLEAWLLTVVALFVACIFIDLSMPFVETLLQRKLPISYGPFEVFLLFSFSVLITLFAGTYPAVFLSSFSAHRTLSGELVHGRTAIYIRKSLLVFQAAISIGLVTSILIFNTQLKALEDLDTGFDTKSSIMVEGLEQSAVFTKGVSSVLERIEREDGVMSAMPIDTKLTDGFLYSFELLFPNGTQSESYIPAIGTGYQPVKNLGLNLLAGREFNVNYASDWFQASDDSAQASIIITKSLALLAGYKTPQDAIGQTFLRDGLSLLVVGVVDDIILGNNRESYSQVLFICGFSLNTDTNVIVNIESDLSILKQAQITNKLQNILANELEMFEPRISLVSDAIQNNLNADKRVLKIVSLFGVLAIVIACIGIFGLASFTIHQKRREIALRKVLGATPISIINLVAKEFVLLVLISALLAWPITYFLMSQWLQEFNTQINQAIWMYLSATSLVLAVTWSTVTCIVFIAAGKSPAEVLRAE
ncbi:FtsX-like permease family protein [Brumicola nitratireducens]|uniref:ABC transporter, permease protein n=1 Tax=Glaciecola nitratireducens (strain JCM 12485 / KCTC 12276 / FR1064) TaxID=1085623 RepID=G4QN56_GLANF|nr:FtsX-like permease family protein [Glaciecola nitratireducens]AEP31475.1 ABC transporter, permease protein [Glaciecola nitratireducens FR1064]